MSVFDLRNCDCMELMRQFPDKHFELAIVDPPYGIGAGKMQMGNGTAQKWKRGEWDSFTPDDKYFVELGRVSKNQIIWGGNYFTLAPTRSWIFWDKLIDGMTSFGDGELAWTSFDTVLRKAIVQYHGFLGAEQTRIHPTQKPVALYRWLLHNYAKPGDKILDTHLGSGSIAIACHEKGFDLTGSELDADYFAAMQKRLETAMMQTTLL